MSYSVKNGNISLTRGDTFKSQITVLDADGNPYIFDEGDKVEFGVKKTYEDTECLIYKEVPTDTLILKLMPEDTKTLSFGDYVYDMQVAKANGEVYTFLTDKTFTLTEEVV